MNIDEIKNLKTKALAASRGPWEMEYVSIGGDNGMVIITEYFVRPNDADYAIASGISDPETGLKSKANADFIAGANPAVVLALIEQLEKVTEARDSLVAQQAELLLANRHQKPVVNLHVENGRIEDVLWQGGLKAYQDGSVMLYARPVLAGVNPENPENKA